MRLGWGARENVPEFRNPPAQIVAATGRMAQEKVRTAGLLHIWLVQKMGVQKGEVSGKIVQRRPGTARQMRRG
jgi:hypothetical protein